MDDNLAAKRFAELGHPTRLAIFRLLVRAGHEGLPVGSIQSALDVPGSTLSHHISRLVAVDLVSQARESRVLRCQPQYDTLLGLIDYLKDECCQGSDCTLDAEAVGCKTDGSCS